MGLIERMEDNAVMSTDEKRKYKREHMRRWRAANLERARERGRRWYAEHREEALARAFGVKPPKKPAKSVKSVKGAKKARGRKAKA